MFLLTFFSQTQNAYVNVAPITSRYKRQRWKIERFADTDLEEYGQADNVEVSKLQPTMKIVIPLHYLHILFKDTYIFRWEIFVPLWAKIKGRRNLKGLRQKWQRYMKNLKKPPTHLLMSFSYWRNLDCFQSLRILIDIIHNTTLCMTRFYASFGPYSSPLWSATKVKTKNFAGVESVHWCIWRNLTAISTLLLEKKNNYKLS